MCAGISSTLISCGGNVWHIFHISLIRILLLFKECHLTTMPTTTMASTASMTTSATMHIIPRASSIVPMHIG
jgi:hypothetical protein